MNRSSLVVVLLLVAALAALMTRSRTEPPSDERSELAWIATARQYGPVGYRDPVGAVSPDGKWLAYSEGRFLRVRPLDGGGSMEFPAGSGQIRHLVWNPDSRRILADGDDAMTWAIYDRAQGTREPLWPSRAETKALRQPAWSPDGRSIVGVVTGREGAELQTISADGRTAESRRVGQRISYPAFTAASEVACIAPVDGRLRITLPCGGAALSSQPSGDAFGPLAFARDGDTAFASFANGKGTVDLWALPIRGGAAKRLTAFSRDSYAPSTAADGSLLFKVQSYRTAVASVGATGGAIRPLAIFQSETPSWDPTGKWIGITYGTWRRVPDDAHYPDIAQDAGIISADPQEPATAPSRVVHDSVSEDQALCWSPNGRWVAFHSHKEQSDDLWLRPADGDTTARRITMLGRGAETGWPRWSRDGTRILFTGASPRTHQTSMYIVGVDQNTGEVTSPAAEVALSGPIVDVLHAEWRGGSDEIVAIVKEQPGRHAIVTVAPAGGTATIVHRFGSEHDNPGLGVSPDGQEAAFIAPGADGFFQIFRIPLRGGPPTQLTTDPSNKTQPAWSPDGGRIAFTVWEYEAQFFRMRWR
jgi:Tol biopolymer transport system component